MHININKYIYICEYFRVSVIYPYLYIECVYIYIYHIYIYLFETSKKHIEYTCRPDAVLYSRGLATMFVASASGLDAAQTALWLPSQVTGGAITLCTCK